jgi:peptidoglycan/LPS O-acetylase OafA/YrhL
LIGSVKNRNNWVIGRRSPSLPLACAWLLAYVLVAYLVVGAIAAQRFEIGWTSAAVAAAICWLSATLTLVATGLTRGPLRPFYGLLYGMLFGFAIPFAAGLYLTRSAPALASAGVFGLIVVFYLVTLAANTLLTVRLTAASFAECASAASAGTSAGAACGARID